ncbi:D-alanyl-lipoteichoic acid biosynthesis protein DltB [Ligilactobacillus salivarius]|uniref:D-alanyl-lipoteichoic acid biosynthesis protein DltB n=1 Tax=Ligilactobacillus salivarius TaxID=1624 RepID=UPI000BB04257|nr:D-alanyl-lipoteichoic acid biosynthesis protein DltB [Ligilactobacillus salivarius]PAY53583.1 D-alanyl-lipoteichoic acid biosynthesis protein DltB [Ligilactobacillus salivarius]PAY62337.1 D-alanyl-lipoteichoic acid biosynthesis protein DltB [Ligilactobacillus salivarius]UXI84884.1 D-alanyl-lipoteichoic acid biosynthesis protein DltB [Ligilactobacillus salivarius]
MFSLTPYQNPTYFLLLGIFFIPIIFGILNGRRFRWYETIVSVYFLYMSFGGTKWEQGVALICYLLFEVILVTAYNKYRKKRNSFQIFLMVTILSILPLIIVKITPFLGMKSIFGFLGISYLTFKAVQTVMEIRDGVIKDFNPWFFLNFLAFFPTISSGPIDRYKRYKKDYYSVPNKEKYIQLLEKGLHYIFLGFLYDFMLSYFFGTVLLPGIKREVIASTGVSLALVEYMYVYSMYLFFNFAGYSLFAVGTSYFMGIETPMNFNQPFKSKNIKEFWNRWHMTLSFWFRDYVYMRLVFFFMKKKVFKNPKTTANITYILNMLLMGFWHGETWYYILYGFIHGVALVVNDWWLGYKKKHKDVVPHNKFTELFAIFITFNFVCFTFLIFSGILDFVKFR